MTFLDIFRMAYRRYGAREAGSFQLAGPVSDDMPSPDDVKAEINSAYMDVFLHLAAQDAVFNPQQHAVYATTTSTEFAMPSDYYSLMAATIYEGTEAYSGTSATGGTSTEIELDSGGGLADDAVNGQYIFLTGGTGSGQRRLISDFASIKQKVTVATAWDVIPDATTTYTIGAYSAAPYELFLPDGGNPRERVDNYYSGRNIYLRGDRFGVLKSLPANGVIHLDYSAKPTTLDETVQSGGNIVGESPTIVPSEYHEVIAQKALVELYAMEASPELSAAMARLAELQAKMSATCRSRQKAVARRFKVTS